MKHGGRVDIQLSRQEAIENFDDRHLFAAFGETGRRLQAEKSSANHDDLPLPRLMRQDFLGVIDRSQGKDAAQINAFHRGKKSRSARGDDQPIESVNPPVTQDNVVIRGIDRLDRGVAQKPYVQFRVEIFSPDDQFGSFDAAPQIFDNPRSGIVESILIRINGQLAFGVPRADGFSRAHSRGPIADYDVLH